MVRRLVALIGHVPGLWLVYREALPPELRRTNLIAVAATLIGVLAVVGLADEVGWGDVVFPWLVGHLLWGAYLAWRLPGRQNCAS
jgi:bacteriorhodopsin